MALTYDSITALVEKFFIPKLQDNVYIGNALTARLTRPDKIMMIDGGERIIAPIVKSKTGTSGRYFSEFDALDTSPTDDFTAAEFTWKQLQEPIKISRLQELKSQGSQAKLRYVAEKMKQAERSIKENLALGIFSDGTASTGALTTSQITGLQNVLSTSSTYGGIAVADMATWIAVVLSNSSVNRALTLNLIESAFMQAAYDQSVPTVMTMRNNIYAVLWSLFTPAQRLVSEEMDSLGFKNMLMVNGMTALYDDHQEANTVYLLNENYLFLAVHEKENLRYDKMDKLEGQAASLGRIYWAGNLVCNGRRYQARIADVATA